MSSPVTRVAKWLGLISDLSQYDRKSHSSIVTRWQNWHFSARWRRCQVICPPDLLRRSSSICPPTPSRRPRCTHIVRTYVPASHFTQKIPVMHSCQSCLYLAILTDIKDIKRTHPYCAPCHIHTTCSHKWFSHATASSQLLLVVVAGTELLSVAPVPEIPVVT